MIEARSKWVKGNDYFQVTGDMWITLKYSHSGM